jgi:hypothetical protein
VRSTPDLSKSEFTGLGQRATTFPVPTPSQSGAPRRSYEDGRFQTNTMSNPNLRQSFQELVSPMDLSSTGTPDSSSTVNSVPRPRYNMPPQFGLTSGLPDLSAMMFPSADPFAYPNQPMMEFESIKQENVNMHSTQPPTMFLSNGASGPGIYDDLEGQLFGPLPPYLMQGQPPFDAAGQIDAGQSLISGLSPPGMTYNTGATPNSDLNFDGIFSGDGEEWSSMMSDQQFR